MRTPITLLLSLASTVALGACDTQPVEIDSRFEWQESVPDMRHALFGGCSFAGVSYAVGGLAKESAIYRWTSRRWAAEATTLQGSRLWDCWAGPEQASDCRWRKWQHLSPQHRGLAS